MNTTIWFVRLAAATMVVSGLLTSCETSGDGNASHAGYYPPGYDAPDVVTTVPRPETPGPPPEHPIAVPPPVVRPVPPMVPMTRPALRR